MGQIHLSVHYLQLQEEVEVVNIRPDMHEDLEAVV